MNSMVGVVCLWCYMCETVGDNWYSRPSELVSPRRE